jgi:D-alanine-D-alanine ligase
LKIVVLYGGTSAERDISLVSGRAVGLALAGRGHDVLLIDPSVGDAPVGAREAAAAAAIGSKPPQILRESGNALRAVAGRAVRDADVVFVALHGGSGEDGTIQGLLDLADKRYTGSGVRGSALAMDKRVSKLIFRAVGVPTPDWRMVSSEGALEPAARGGAPSFPDDRDVLRARLAASELGGYPLIVKPNDQGSTVGLTLVEREADLDEAVVRALVYSRHVLLEEYIPGREMTVAVLGREAFPVVEIIPKGGLYDYESKYTKGKSEYVCPAEIPASMSKDLKSAALAAFAALGCRGYARVDFRVPPDGGISCLEVNTTPGMTELSLVPMAAGAVGMSFSDLVERIVQMALI